MLTFRARVSSDIMKRCRSGLICVAAMTATAFLTTGCGWIRTGHQPDETAPAALGKILTPSRPKVGGLADGSEKLLPGRRTIDVAPPFAVLFGAKAWGDAVYRDMLIEHYMKAVEGQIELHNRIVGGDKETGK